MESKKVFVSGCYDGLHTGHIQFLNEARALGDELYVSVGTDATIKQLKNVIPMYNETERVFMVNALKSVTKAFLPKGSGMMDFAEDLRELSPDIFAVKKDGYSEAKKELCDELGIELFIIPEREFNPDMIDRRSAELRKKASKLPYRIDLAGGWLDQPHVSKIYPGPVITISIEPTEDFHLRSGMATSTRKSAMRLWGNEMPEGNPVHLAEVLFRYDNPPGTKIISGSQDSIGMMLPSLNCSHYDGEHWPKKIENINDEKILSWLEERIYLVSLGEREYGYEACKDPNLTKEAAQSLSEAASECFSSICEMNFEKFADSFLGSFRAQTALFPASLPEELHQTIEKYRAQGARGWKLSGAGGGGYLILVSEHPIEGVIKIKIRRENNG